MAIIAVFLMSLFLFETSLAFLAGQHHVTPPSSNVDCSRKSPEHPGGQCVPLSRNCSSNFFETCREWYDNRTYAYFPNCLGHRSEEEANIGLGSFLNTIKNNKNNIKAQECLNLLKPFICTTYYPYCFPNNDNTFYRMSSCYRYCQDTQDVCKEAGIVSPYTCEQMYDKTICPATLRNPSCIEPPKCKTASPSCYEECKEETLPMCTGVKTTCGKNTVRDKISKKLFIRTSNYGFGARVNITEEVYLCKPEKRIAYKAVIIEDYFMSYNTCRSDFERCAGDTVYILADDDKVNDCSKQCVRNDVKLNKEYLVMGQLEETHQSECGHKLWVFKDKKSVLYPWKDVTKDKKESKIGAWAKQYYTCKARA